MFNQNLSLKPDHNTTPNSFSPNAMGSGGHKNTMIEHLKEQLHYAEKRSFHVKSSETFSLSELPLRQLVQVETVLNNIGPRAKLPVNFLSDKLSEYAEDCCEAAGFLSSDGTALVLASHDGSYGHVELLLSDGRSESLDCIDTDEYLGCSTGWTEACRHAFSDASKAASFIADNIG